MVFERTTAKEASVSEVTTIGLDLAKAVFQAHGADASGSVMFRKRLRRVLVLEFFSAQPRCLVAMEACVSAHYWAREISTLGHETRLIPVEIVGMNQATRRSSSASPFTIRNDQRSQNTDTARSEQPFGVVLCRWSAPAPGAIP